MIDLNRLNQLLNPAGMIGQQQQPSPFNPNGSTSLSTGQDPFSGSGDDDLNRALLSLLSPKDVQYDRFTEMLKNIPQRADYKPSTGRKIAGFIAGLGSGEPLGISGGQPIGYKSNIPEGLKVQSAITDEPYNKALADWGTRATPTLEAAKLENTRNVNSRIAGSNVKTAQLREQGIQRQLSRDEQLAKEGDQRIAASQAKMEIDKKKAAAVDFKNAHPKHKLVTAQDGEMFFVNPEEPDSKPIDTGLKGTDLSDMEKINLQHEGRLEEIAARGDQQRETNKEKPDSEKGWSVVPEYDPDSGKWIRNVRVNAITGERQEIKGSAGPKAPPKKPTEESETQKKQGMINKANQIISSNPELKGYIIIEKNNAGNPIGAHIRPRGMMGMEPFYDEAKATKAYNLLFGEEKKSTTDTGDKVLMTSPDGKTKGYVPKNQVEEAKKQGYK